MPDKTEPKDLEMVLAKLKEEWRELADLLTSQGKSQDRVIEVEKILLRDASGQYRGKISANPDGSADLLLSDRSGNAWARLGVNQDGEAFLELKDKQGESSFKVGVGAPSSGAGAGLAATPVDAAPPAAPQPLISGRFPPAHHACRGRRRTTGGIGLRANAASPRPGLAPGRGRQFRGDGSPGKIGASESASENLLGPYPGGVRGDPGHPGLCAFSPPPLRLGRGSPGGAGRQRQGPGLPGHERRQSRAGTVGPGGPPSGHSGVGVRGGSPSGVL